MNSNPYLYLATWVHTLTSIDAAGQASERTTTETTWASNTVVTVVTTIEGGVTVSTTIAAHLVSQTATGDSATSQTPAGITTQPDQPTVPPDSVPATSVQISTPTLTTTTTITVPATSPATSPAGTLPTTAASTTSSPAPAQTTSSTPSGISSGVVAGIGIACAVVGAALATCVLCYFVVRRRNARKRRSSGRDRLVTEKSGIALGPWSAWRKNGPFVGSTLAAVETSLPPPLQDSEVADGLLRLGKSITSHAGSYFNTGAVAKPSDVNQDYLAQLLGQNAPFRAAELTYLLANTTARTAAVRFLLAWCILQHVQGESDPCKSLLPPEIAESLESMNATELHDDKHATILSHWRHLTAHLMSSTYDVNAEVAVHDPRQRNIGDLTDALEAVLSPLASRGQDAGRRQDLEGLIVRGAQYGWLLFSQPTTWAFDWEIDIGPHGEGVGAGELVILPALMQTGDETGKRHKIARGITEAQRVKLGS